MAEVKPIKVTIDGQQANQTLSQMGREIASLKREQAKLVPQTEEWLAATRKLVDAEERFKNVKEEARETADAMRGFDLSKFGEAGGLVQRVKDQFSDLKGGVGSAVQSFGLLKTAIAGTGIGLLIIAFTTLVTWFQKTDDGAKKLDGIMRGIGATIDILTNLLFKAGEALIKTFSNPKQAMIDLGNFLVNNLINRFTALGEILEGIINLDFKQVANGSVQLATGVEDASGKMKGLVDSTKQLGSEIGKAVDEGMELAEMLDKIDEDRRKTELASAQNEKLINRLLLQAKNRTTTEAERIALLDRAGKLEMQNHKMQVDLNAQNIAAIEFELAQKIRAANTEVSIRKKTNAELVKLLMDGKLKSGTIDDKKDLDRYNEVLIAREQLDMKSIEVQEKINNRRDALEQAAQQKREKAAEARRKKEEEQRKALEDRQNAELEAFQKIQDKEIALIQDETERKIAALNLQAQREKEAAEKSKANVELKAGLVLAIENKLAADIAQVQADAAKTQKDNSEKAAKEELDLKRRQAQAKADLEVALAQASLNKANKSGDFTTQQAAEKALLDAQIAQIQTRAQLEIESTQKTEAEKQLIIAQSQAQIDQIRDQYAQADRQRNAQTAADILGGFQTAFSTMAEFGAIQSQKELQRLDRDKAARLRSLDDEFRRGKMSKTAYEQSKAQIEQGFSDQTRSIKRQQAEEQKKWNVAQAIMQGAIAVLAASANPLGIWSPTAIATAIMAGLNVAKVIATPVPEFAKGGLLPKFGKGGVPDGPSHSQGGLKLVDPAGKVVGEIEGGEPILSKATYQNNKAIIDMLLDSSVNRQGASIAIDPGIVRAMRYETGGVLPGSSPQPAFSNQLELQVLLEKIYQLLVQQHSETQKTIQNMDTVLKAYVVTEELGEALNQLRDLKREAQGVANDGKTENGTVILNDLF